MMKRLLYAAFLVIAIPATLLGARLQFSLPPGLASAQLLSGGTAAMLDYEKSKAEAEIRALKGEFQVDPTGAGMKKGSEQVDLAKKAYAAKIASLRARYASLLSIQLTSARADMNLSTSALAEVSYMYTARNSSDRIITDISYKPLIGGKPLSTSSTFILEFMDPTTLKSGLGPGETMTNQGHEPEKFSFFLGEITPEEVKSMQQDFGRKFGMEIVDMHFATQKDYKGQFKPQTFEEAFAPQLAGLQNAIRQTETKAREMGESDTKALKEFKARKDSITARENRALAGLKKSAVRYTAIPDKKGRFVFEDVAPGTYFIYAGNVSGMAVFDKITVGEEKKQKKTITQMKKDPFRP